MNIAEVRQQLDSFAGVLIILGGLAVVLLVAVTWRALWERAGQKAAEVEWMPFDQTRLDAGVCPYHDPAPADGSECACTWLLTPKAEEALTERRAAAATHEEVTRLWANVLDGARYDDPIGLANRAAGLRARAGDLDSIDPKGGWRI